MTNPYKCRLASQDSPLIAHAKHELQAIGMFDGDPMNESMAKDILELLAVFSKQGHSGASASYTIDLFRKLANFEPLATLTGEDSEWIDQSDSGLADDEQAMYQNKRASHVFKIVYKDGSVECYDINGRVFEEPNGVRYTSSQSRVPVTFPYTPKTEVVKVPYSKDAGAREYLPKHHYLYFV